MKIKVFSGKNPGVIERQINRFIQGKKVIDIKQSEAIGGASPVSWCMTISILYEELSEDEH